MEKRNGNERGWLGSTDLAEAFSLAKLLQFSIKAIHTCMWWWDGGGFVCICVCVCACVSKGFFYFPYKMENFLYVAFVSFSSHVKWFSTNPHSTNTSFSAHSHLFRKLCKCIYKQLCFWAAMFVRWQPQNFARIFPQLRGIFIFLPNFLPLKIVFFFFQTVETTRPGCGICF